MALKYFVNFENFEKLTKLFKFPGLLKRLEFTDEFDTFWKTRLLPEFFKIKDEFLKLTTTSDQVLDVASHLDQMLEDYIRNSVPEFNQHFQQKEQKLRFIRSKSCFKPIVPNS